MTAATRAGNMTNAFVGMYRRGQGGFSFSFNDGLYGSLAWGDARSSPLISPYNFFFVEQQYIQGKEVPPWDRKSKVDTPFGMR